MFKDSKAFFSFSVSDSKKAKEFYGKVLGLETSEPMDQLELKLGSGAKVFVYEKPDHTPATFTLLNFPVDDIKRSVAALKERGVRFEPYESEEMKTNAEGIADCEGRKMAWFKDPAGNYLALIEQAK